MHWIRLPIRLLIAIFYAGLLTAASPAIGWQDLPREIKSTEVLPTIPPEYSLDLGTPEEIAQLETRFAEALEKMRELLVAARQAEMMFRLGGWEESDRWFEQWEQTRFFGTFVRRELERNAYYLMLKSEQPSKEVIDFCRLTIGPLFDDFQYEMVFQLADRIRQLDPGDLGVQEMWARSVMLTNRFDKALAEADLIQQFVSNMPPHEITLFQRLRTLAEPWKRELEIRNLEMEADDLPQVELTTSEGRIVLELFDDQYPETVGNFINLVERGYYENTVFYRVIKNYIPLSIAQVGSEGFVQNEGSGGFSGRPNPIDYAIMDETPQGESRRHWRGVVSMMKRYSPDGKSIPNSAAADFFIVLTPSPIVDDELVPFGRVISDMAIVDRIRVNTEVDEKEGRERTIELPDYTLLFEARVLRKRDRDYRPNKVPAQQGR